MTLRSINFTHVKKFNIGSHVSEHLVRHDLRKRYTTGNRGQRHKSNPRGQPVFVKQKWWAPLRSGLIRDPTGRHYKTIRKAVWLYLYLLTAANWLTGRLFVRIETIARETSFSRRSIHRWLEILRRRGYIRSRSNGRSLDISIEKWRPISRK